MRPKPQAKSIELICLLIQCESAKTAILYEYRIIVDTMPHPPPHHLTHVSQSYISQLPVKASGNTDLTYHEIAILKVNN